MSHREDRKRQLQRAHERMALLKSRPCTDCGRTFPPECMDFDHVRGEKVSDVSHLKRRALKVILAEIEKCDLVCACCHRIRTARRSRQKWGY